MDRVLIVCEGAKTEPGYLNKLISEYRVPTAKVRVHGECGAAPISVFEFTERQLRRDPDFEHIFLIFDRDTHPTYCNTIVKTEGLRKKNKFKSKNIEAITSVPCFEIWLILHVSNTARPYGQGIDAQSPAQKAIQDLRAFPEFSNYAKSDTSFFERIKAKTGLAIGRAKRQIEQARTAGSPRYQEDPSTRFFLVVETLKKISGTN